MIPENLNLSLDQLGKLARQFKLELQAAQVGEPSSLSFLFHPLPQPPSLQGQLQVISIGGTNLRSALVISASRGYRLENFTRQTLLKLDQDQFISLISSNLNHNTKYLALNLAFPLRPHLNQGLLDGILIRATKEHDFQGMIGQSLVSTLSPHLPASPTLSVGNDAACLALASIPVFSAPSLALVLGTGFNLAFYDGQQINNIEAGRFNQLPQTPLDRLLDHSSQAPGTQILEKQVAGGYLASLFNLYASSQNLPQVTTTSELAGLTQSHPGYQLAQALFLRSASLVSASLCGYAEYAQTHQLNLLAEGSLFWSSYYSTQVKSFLEKLNPELKLNLKQLPHSGLIGAARLFLPDQQITS